MRRFNRITHWENRARIERLRSFRNLVEEYFAGVEYEMGEPYPVRDDLPQIRAQLNQRLPEVGDIVSAAGTRRPLLYRAAPAAGGWQAHMDPLDDLFRLHQLQVGHEEALDQLDRAIGVYERDARRAGIRSFNPFFYLSLLFDWIVGVPFALAARVGFDRPRLEASVLGRLLKAAGQLVLWLFAVLKAVQELGWLDNVVRFLRVSATG